LVRCTVTNELARRGNAFSIGATVRDYEIVNADRRDFYGLIKAAELTELSLTDVPANSGCRVLRRNDVCALTQHYDHIKQFVDGLSRAVALMQTTTGARA
jgi:hypothetical protein